MQKNVLVVSRAVGNLAVVDEVLQRFGFAPAVQVDGVGEGLELLRKERFDLAFLPLSEVGTLQLAEVERLVRQQELPYIIGTAPRPEPELIVQALRAGVHEFLVSPPDPTELTTAVDRLFRRTVGREAQPGSVIAVYSAKGGLGTTSIALNVAFGLARSQPTARVAVADFVVSGGDVRVLLDLKAEYDIGDLMARMERIDAELLQSILAPVEGGVWVLPSTEKPEVAELVDAAAAATIIGQLRTHYAYTVLDCEHHLTERTLAALDLADTILLVTQLNVAAMRSTQRTLALAERLGYGSDKIKVVVNRYQGNDVLSLKDAAELLDRPVFFNLPNDYRSSAAAQAKGLSVFGHDSTSRLAQSYTELAARLAGAEHPSRNGKSRAPGSRIGRLFGIRK